MKNTNTILLCLLVISLLAVVNYHTPTFEMAGNLLRDAKQLAHVNYRYISGRANFDLLLVESRLVSAAFIDSVTTLAEKLNQFLASYLTDFQSGLKHVSTSIMDFSLATLKHLSSYVDQFTSLDMNEAYNEWYGKNVVKGLYKGFNDAFDMSMDFISSSIYHSLNFALTTYQVLQTTVSTHFAELKSYIVGSLNDSSFFEFFGSMTFDVQGLYDIASTHANSLLANFNADVTFISHNFESALQSLDLTFVEDGWDKSRAAIAQYDIELVVLSVWAMAVSLVYNAIIA